MRLGDADDGGFFRRQVVLEQDGDAAEFRHQHPDAGNVECPRLAARYRHTEERHQSAANHLRVTAYLLTYLLTYLLVCLFASSLSCLLTC